MILTGEIDVSIGATLGMSAAVGATILRDGGSVVTAVLAAVSVGAVIGLVNGFGVSILNIPSLIFTLGVNGVVRGLIYVYTGGAWVENLPASFTKASNIKIAEELTLFYAVTIVLVLIANYIVTKTRKGRYFTAVGDNISGATLVGIPTVQTKILAYVICGIMAAVAGMVYASRIGFITPTAGNNYEMKAIAACVLGGVALTGGQGSLFGAAIGAIIMSSISRILVFLGFSSDYDNTITGIMLIVIVVVTTVAQNHGIVKNRHEILKARTNKAKSNAGRKEIRSMKTTFPEKAKKFFTSWEFVLLLILFAEIVIFATKNPKFLMPRVLFGSLNDIISICIISLFVTFVMITGGIDIQAGSIVGLSSIVLGVAWQDGGMNIWAAVALAVVVAGVCGALSGYFVAYCGVQPMVVTLGGSFLFTGVALLVSNLSATESYKGISGFPDSFLQISKFKLFGVIPCQVIIFLVLAVIAMYF